MIYIAYQSYKKSTIKMEKTDRIINLIREMMVANSTGSGGGFGGDSPAVGPRAGLHKFLGKTGRIDYRRVPSSYKKWIKNLYNNK